MEIFFDTIDNIEMNVFLALEKTDEFLTKVTLSALGISIMIMSFLPLSAIINLL
jgi:hypothetical protein